MVEAKYKQLAATLEQRIQDGTYVVGKTIPPEIQLQKEFQLSRHTVRQAIALLVQEGYLKSEKGSGTFVLRRNKENFSTEYTPTKKIGVVMTYLSDYIFPEIIRGIEGKLSEAGYSLLLASTNNQHEKERECLMQMFHQQVDGLIVEPTKSNQFNPNFDLYAKISQSHLPLVMLNANYDAFHFPCARVDDEQCGFLATEYLIKQQHTRLLMVVKIDDLQGKLRLNGMMQACEKYGLQFFSEDIITYTTEDMKNVAAQVLQRITHIPEITGIVCYNDEIAYKIMHELKLHDFHIPEDYAIMGIDNASISGLTEVNLTTMNHPKEDLGKAAAEMIMQLIDGEKIEDQLFQPFIVKRKSI